MARVLGLDHVGLHVEDVATSVAFYRDVLGLAEKPRPDLGFPGAWFALGTGQELHLIGKNARPDLPPTERHFSLRVDDARAFVPRLDAAPVSYEPPRLRPDGALQLFLRDPDGHVVELLSS